MKPKISTAPPAGPKKHAAASRLNGATLARPVPDIPVQWAWHYRALQKLREQLLMERGGLREIAAEPMEPHSLSMADSATDEFDHDLALSQMSSRQDLLNEVDQALKRIQNGTYGICEETGKPIPGARLKAIPWTRFTKVVEARLENTCNLNRPHLGTLGSVRPGATNEPDESEVEDAS